MNTQKVIMTRKPSLPRDKEVTSRDSLIEKGEKRKEKWDFWIQVKLGLETFGLRKRERERERVTRP